MSNCSFTGHRVLTVTESLTRRLDLCLVELTERGIFDFYAGGAVGWDMLCENAVLRLRERLPQVRLHLILPCSPAAQTARWSFSQRSEYEKIRKAADSVEILSAVYHRDCMKNRNARLVELGDVLVCCCDETRVSGGTVQTVRMAQRKNMEIINLYQ